MVLRSTALSLAAAAALAPAAAAHGITGSGPAKPAAPHQHGTWTVRQGRNEIRGYERDGKWIAGMTITDCRKLSRSAVRCTITTPPIALTTDPSEIPQVWSWQDTARPNPGPPLWWNVVSSDPAGSIVLAG